MSKESIVVVKGGELIQLCLLLCLLSYKFKNESIDSDLQILMLLFLSLELLRELFNWYSWSINDNDLLILSIIRFSF